MEAAETGEILYNEITENIEDTDHCYSVQTFDLERVLSRELTDFNKEGDTYCGYMNGGVDRFNAFLSHLRSLGYPFSVRNSMQRDLSIMPRFIFSYWKETINVKFFGAPFCISMYYDMDCLRGPMRGLKGDVNSMIQTSSDNLKKNKKPSKKMGCPAKLIVKVIRYFPQYSVETNDKARIKAKAVGRLRLDYFNPDCTIQYGERVYIALSKENIHTHKPIHFSHPFREESENISTVLAAVRTAYSDDEQSDNEDSHEKIQVVDDLGNKQEELREMAQIIMDITDFVTNSEVLQSSVESMKDLFENLKKSIPQSVDEAKANEIMTDKEEGLVSKSENSCLEYIRLNNETKNTQDIVTTAQTKMPVLLHVCQNQDDILSQVCLNHIQMNQESMQQQNISSGTSNVNPICEKNTSVNLLGENDTILNTCINDHSTNDLCHLYHKQSTAIKNQSPSLNAKDSQNLSYLINNHTNSLYFSQECPQFQSEGISPPKRQKQTSLDKFSVRKKRDNTPGQPPDVLLQGDLISKQ